MAGNGTYRTFKTQILHYLFPDTIFKPPFQETVLREELHLEINDKCHLYTDLSGSLIQGIISHHIDIPITAVTCCPCFQWSPSKLSVWSRPVFCCILMEWAVNKNAHCFNWQCLRQGIRRRLPSHDAICYANQCYRSGEEYGIDPASRGKPSEMAVECNESLPGANSKTGTAIYWLLTHSHFNKAQLQVSLLY